MIAKRDADGRVMIKPPNFVTKGPKMGKDESVYFQRASYNCRGDLYKSRSEAVLRTAASDTAEGSEQHSKSIYKHDAPFKPGISVK